MTATFHNIDRQESLKMFLLGLLPELKVFNDTQIKILKQRIFSLIDETSSPPQLPYSSPLTMLLPQ